MERLLREIMGMQAFQKARVVAGIHGLDRPVSSVTLMEVPDILAYVEEKSLLLTTLYPIMDNKMEIETLIPSLMSKNVAGICIKPRRYVKDIPQIILEQADQYDFPVIELPDDANLSTLASQVLSVTLNDQVAQIQLRDHVQQNMTELMLSGAQIGQMLAELAKIFNRDVLLQRKDCVELCSVRRQADGSWKQFDGPFKGDGAETSADRAHSITCQIKAGKSHFGYLVILDADREDQILVGAAEQAAKLFATMFYKSDLVMTQERKFQDLFIQDLLNGKVFGKAEIKKRLKIFDLSLDFPLYVTMVSVESDEANREKTLDQIKKCLERKASYNGFKNCVCISHQEALVELSTSTSDEQIRTRYEQFLEELATLGIGPVKVGIGISRPVDSFQGLKLAYRQAASVIDLNRKLCRASFVRTYTQSQLLELIEKIPDTQFLASYVEDKLGRIIEYDRKNSSQLMKTLQALIQTNFNFKKAAEQSFMHYNTIRYRANKMINMGLCFEPGQELAEIVLAYNIYLLLNAREE